MSSRAKRRAGRVMRPAFFCRIAGKSGERRRFLRTRNRRRYGSAGSKLCVNFLPHSSQDMCAITFSSIVRPVLSKVDQSRIACRSRAAIARRALAKVANRIQRVELTIAAVEGDHDGRRRAAEDDAVADDVDHSSAVVTARQQADEPA